MLTTTPEALEAEPLADLEPMTLDELVDILSDCGCPACRADLADLLGTEMACVLPPTDVVH